MTGHTKGPWVARPDPNGTSNDWCIGLDDDVSPVDYVATCSKRDARLIAAAPLMLETLRLIASAHSRGFDVHYAEGAALAAIAKATGPQS